VEYQKIKSVSKVVQTRGPALEKTILATMRTIADLVGGTLGPGGRQVLIERYEHDLPPIVTKDGVTVFRAMGFEDPSAHCVLEAARDAAVRTASEAGDGTTTATILAEAIVRRAKIFCEANPRVSPQKVVRVLEQTFRDVIEPVIRSASRTADLSVPEGRSLLQSVAYVSANGDRELAQAVIQCFDLVGDDGNVTISEVSGPSGYEVDKLEGFSVPIGYEESCGKFAPKFVNDVANQRIMLERPGFILYHGRLSEIQTLLPLLEQLGVEWQSNGGPHNFVVFATGFSEQVLTHLAFNFPEAGSMNILPVLIPQSPFPNGQLHFLQDIAAITGAKILDSLSNPIDKATPSDLGPGVEHFECSRFRSSIVGKSASEEGAQLQEDLILLRVDELKAQHANAASQLERVQLEERIGRITGGIARLKVVGPSNGETKEKRDRAEDAVCAVRGAIKHGYLPGGGWTLLKLATVLKLDKNPIIQNVLLPALLEPVNCLFCNAGFHSHEIDEILNPIFEAIGAHGQPLVYDILEGRHAVAEECGILDSTPAVLEAIRNSISIASLLGTLGGTCVFRRDHALERSEALDTLEYIRNSNVGDPNDKW